MLLFTPELCRRDPLAVLEAALPHVDLVQVRIKAEGLGIAPARATHEWTERVLALAAAHSRVLVLVNDRVDVAGVLAARGVAGVHLGADDSPPELARALLGEESLIGLSTHGAAEVAAAEDRPVDYLGFGPVFASTTKRAARVLGSEAAWIAARASSRPLFPIGGIDLTNALELAPVGRAAVSAAILGAEDPGRAARELRALLER
jgi:thiamine-phosphate diphosphorylase